MTLLELILVMFLLAVLFGGGLGMFASLDLGAGQAAGLVKNVLRSAHNTAIASRAPARVRIDREAGALQAQALQVVGTWRFEDRRLAGGNDLLGRVDPELFVRDGYLGDALSFTDRRGSVGTIPVDLDPAFDFTDGFAIECVVRHEGLGGGRLLSVASAVTIELGQAGEVRGRVQGAKEEDGLLGGAFTVTSRPGVVAPMRWTRVRLSYDRYELVLAIDDARVAVLRETAAVIPIDGPLVLSDPRRPFPGSVDDLVVSALVAGESAELADSVQLVVAPEAVHFAPGGGLDRRHHAAPVRLVLGFDDGRRTELGVGFYGTVE